MHPWLVQFSKKLADHYYQESTEKNYNQYREHLNKMKIYKRDLGSKPCIRETKTANNILRVYEALE